MPYDITTNQEYIRVYYWGNGDVANRLNHTHQLATISQFRKQTKFLIDTRDLDSMMEPIDFDSLAHYLLENNLAPQSKIALLCEDTNQRPMYAKFNLNCQGLACDVFHDNETAKHWLGMQGEKELAV